MMRRGVKGVMTAILLIFTGYLSISGAAAGTADAVTLKTTRLAISSMVPVVGRHSVRRHGNCSGGSGYDP